MRRLCMQACRAPASCRILLVAPVAAGPCSYPHALYFLDLLQTPEFRAKIANPAYKELAHTQQFYFWQVGVNARCRFRVPP